MNSSPQRPFTVSQSVYPFDPNWFERNGSFLHYLDEGEGLPVLMLHGTPAWSFLYRKVIKQLSGSCRSIVPDLPGFGFSDHPPDYDYTPQEHAEWVSALIDHLSLDSFILVVHDWGGPIGMSIAVSRPDQIAGLVITNTWSWRPDYPIWRIFSAIFSSGLGKYLILRRNILVGRMLPMMLTRSDVKTPEVLKAYRDPFPTPDSRIGLYAFPRALSTSDEWLDSIENNLHLLSDKPIELIIGKMDPFYPHEKIVAQWQKHFPRAAVDLVPDAGHFLEEESPENVVEAIRRIINRQAS